MTSVIKTCSELTFLSSVLPRSSGDLTVVLGGDSSVVSQSDSGLVATKMWSVVVEVLVVVVFQLAKSCTVGRSISYKIIIKDNL